MNCISCNHEHDENYCPKCGEKSGVKRIDLVSLMEGVASSLTTMDRGFLYNFKTLLIKPKTIVKDYIKGKRKGILNPISYLVISITVYLVIIALIKFPRELKEVEEINSEYKKNLQGIGLEVGYFIHEYIKYFWILTIIPMGATLKIFFGRFNYIEHLAIGAFVIGQATIIGIASYLIFHSPLIFDPIVYASILLLMFRIFLDKKVIFESIVKIVFAFLLFMLLLLLSLGAIALVKVYFG